MPNKKKKEPVHYPEISMTVTPNDFDIPAILMGTDGRLCVEIPDEVLPVLRKMCNARVEGKMSLTVTIAGYVK